MRDFFASYQGNDLCIKDKIASEFTDSFTVLILYETLKMKILEWFQYPTLLMEYKYIVFECSLITCYKIYKTNLKIPAYYYWCYYYFYANESKTEKYLALPERRGVDGQTKPWGLRDWRL